jgi:N-acetylneuraminic acid mutarotase
MSQSNCYWTYMRGDSMVTFYQLYGSKGVSSDINNPTARSGSVSWKDLSGNLWLFGGYGYDDGSTLNPGKVNDLWKYDISVNQWVWISGNKTLNTPGIYGAKGIPNINNNPGARSNCVTWTDLSGNLWLFGGEGYDINGNKDYLNDLWEYIPSTNQWTWISGDNTIDIQGAYGTKGNASLTNKPGSRSRSVAWVDATGNFWLIGGYGYGTSVLGSLNDLWKYDPLIKEWTWVNGDSTTNVFGIYGTKGSPAAANNPGSRLNSVSWVDDSGYFWLFGGTGKANSGTGLLNDLWKYDPSINQWTWIKGDSVINKIAVFGTKEVEFSSNIPGSRDRSLAWKDASNNLWLLGGNGFLTNGAVAQDLNDLWKYNPSSNNWTWMKGDSISFQYNKFGVQGVEDSSNKPRSLTEMVGWTDLSGNFWFFGGAHNYPSLNILWKYNTLTNNWTWVKGNNGYGIYGTQGVASSLNKPGPRLYGVTWKDSADNFWLFGGSGLAANDESNGYLNDLWKYNFTTNQWTWMKGDDTTGNPGVYGVKAIASPLNKPGARHSSVSWIDQVGDFWLFGGFCNMRGGWMNDLWKYSPVNNQWTWISGDSIGGVRGVYGVLGIPDPLNKPGGRMQSVSWTDNAGNLFLFGGQGYDANGSFNNLNDLWKYDPVTNLWTWMKGSKLVNGTGSYGTRGQFSATNTPGNRIVASAMTDNSGNFWLFGGSGYFGGNVSFNDLWEYKPSINQWAWISGDNFLTNVSGIYGTLGTEAASNKPGSRSGHVSWVDISGNIWLFGGAGYASGGSSGYLNDVWRYNPLTDKWAWMKGNNSVALSGFNKGGTYGPPGTTASNLKPCPRSNVYSWIDKSGNAWIFSGYNSYGANSTAPDPGVFYDLWYFSNYQTTGSLCPGGNSSFTSNLSGTTYQWQLSTDGVNFNNLSNNTNYAGVTTNTLQLIAIPSAWYGYQYRCVVNGSNSNVFNLTFKNYWIGAISNAWENPGNWSCGSVPDSNTDVYINTGATVILGSSASIATLNLNPTASLTVNPPYILTLLGH